MWLLQKQIEEDLAVIVLQLVIRGCATNVHMVNGMSQNVGLLVELRMMRPLWDESKYVLEMKLKRQRIGQQHQQEQLLFVIFSTLFYDRTLAD